MNDLCLILPDSSSQEKQKLCIQLSNQESEHDDTLTLPCNIWQLKKTSTSHTEKAI